MREKEAQEIGEYIKTTQADLNELNKKIETLSKETTIRSLIDLYVNSINREDLADKASKWINTQFNVGRKSSKHKTQEGLLERLAGELKNEGKSSKSYGKRERVGIKL